MPRRPMSRQCTRCGRVNDGALKACGRCGTALIRKRFVMKRSRRELVHALAAQKGLITRHDDELYRQRLAAYGYSSSMEIRSLKAFNRFIRDMKRLPDAAPRHGRVE